MLVLLISGVSYWPRSCVILIAQVKNIWNLEDEMNTILGRVIFKKDLAIAIIKTGDIYMYMCVCVCIFMKVLVLAEYSFLQDKI